MAGRFAPPPDVQANTRRRLLVLRTSHRRLRARRFAQSPYAGTDVPRHHPPLQLHCSYPQPQRRLSMLRRPASPCCKRRCAFVQLITAHCLLRLIHVCRSQKRPCSGMFASYAHRYQSRVRLAFFNPGPIRQLVQFMFMLLFRDLFSPFAVYILSRNVIQRSKQCTPLP